MTTLSAKLTFYIPHASSLKEKRSVSRGLMEKTKNKYNASVAEVGTQDMHQTLTLGIAVVPANLRMPAICWTILSVIWKKSPMQISFQ